MRVKIGNTWYSGNDQPLCIEISEQEQEHIANMDRGACPNGRYAQFPESMNLPAEVMLSWMADEIRLTMGNSDEEIDSI